MGAAVVAGYMATEEEMEETRGHRPRMVTVDVWGPRETESTGGTEEEGVIVPLRIR